MQDPGQYSLAQRPPETASKCPRKIRTPRVVSGEKLPSWPSRPAKVTSTLCRVTLPNAVRAHLKAGEGKNGNPFSIPFRKMKANTEQVQVNLSYLRLVELKNFTFVAEFDIARGFVNTLTAVASREMWHGRSCHNQHIARSVGLGIEEHNLNHYGPYESKTILRICKAALR
jgi:hypothetical protein